jgi:hypothetical protein
VIAQDVLTTHGIRVLGGRPAFDQIGGRPIVRRQSLLLDGPEGDSHDYHNPDRQKAFTSPVHLETFGQVSIGRWRGSRGFSLWPLVAEKKKNL